MNKYSLIAHTLLAASCPFASAMIIDTSEVDASYANEIKAMTPEQRHAAVPEKVREGNTTYLSLLAKEGTDLTAFLYDAIDEKNAPAIRILCAAGAKLGNLVVARASRPKEKDLLQRNIKLAAYCIGNPSQKQIAVAKALIESDQYTHADLADILALHLKQAVATPDIIAALCAHGALKAGEHAQAEALCAAVGRSSTMLDHSSLEFLLAQEGINPEAKLSNGTTAMNLATRDLNADAVALLTKAQYKRMRVKEQK